jgi:pantoate--beta-alanine ligase
VGGRGMRHRRASTTRPPPPTPPHKGEGRRPTIARNIAALGKFRAARESVALVPTMGALHAGHLALVRRARRRADRVVVSIFVNPTQFAPHEDFASYPRAFEADIAALAAEEVDLVWAPARETMYGPGFATTVVVKGPAAADLEDRFRPHFFGGVATVVAKLFAQCRPDFALFGEKDYQQLKTIERLAADLDLKVKIIGVPTVREKDGLALSSRNVYLSAAERAAAPTLYRTLKESAARIAAGEPIARVMSEGWIAIEAAGFAVDYFEARHAETLARVENLTDGPLRLLAAGRLGTTRLIDNVPV